MKKFLYIVPLKQGLKLLQNIAKELVGSKVFIHSSIKTRIETNKKTRKYKWRFKWFLYIVPLKQGLKLRRKHNQTNR